MNAKHTPGPWTASAENRPSRPPFGGFERQVRGPLNDLVAHAYGDTAEDCCSHARLIAAAPELLEALKGMVALYEAMHAAKPFVDSRPGRALEAIAKAEGRA